MLKMKGLKRLVLFVTLLASIATFAKSTTCFAPKYPQFFKRSENDGEVVYAMVGSEST